MAELRSTSPALSPDPATDDPASPRLPVRGRHSTLLRVAALILGSSCTLTDLSVTTASAGHRPAPPPSPKGYRSQGARGGRRAPPVPSRPHPRGDLRRPPGWRATGAAPRGRRTAGQCQLAVPTGRRAAQPGCHSSETPLRLPFARRPPVERRPRPLAGRSRQCCSGSGTRVGRADGSRGAEELRFELAASLLLAGRIVDAVDDFGPSSDRHVAAVQSSARVCLGHALLAAGKPLARLKSCAEPTRRRWPPATPLMSTCGGTGEPSVGDLAGAATLSERACTSAFEAGDPVSTLAWRSTSGCLRAAGRQGRFDEALDAVDEALRRADDSPGRARSPLSAPPQPWPRAHRSRPPRRCPALARDRAPDHERRWACAGRWPAITRWVDSNSLHQWCVG